jgi:hypothetical protein
VPTASRRYHNWFFLLIGLQKFVMPRFDFSLGFLSPVLQSDNLAGAIAGATAAVAIP